MWVAYLAQAKLRKNKLIDEGLLRAEVLHLGGVSSRGAAGARLTRTYSERSLACSGVS